MLDQVKSRPARARFDDATIVTMVRQGFGRREMEQHFGCTQGSLKRKLNDLSLIAPMDTIPRMPAENIPKVRKERFSGAVSLPALSIFTAMLEGKP